MTIDEKLYTIIDSNTNIVDKLWFKNGMQFAKDVYNIYGVDYKFDNILDAIKYIKFVNDDTKKDFNYDVDTNTISIGVPSENLNYSMCKIFLQITSQKGLIRKDSDGNEQLKNLNNIVIDKLILNTTNLSNKIDTNEDIYTMSKEDEIQAEKDELIYNINKIVPIREVVSHFANGQGEELYNKYFSQKVEIQTM